MITTNRGNLILQTICFFVLTGCTTLDIKPWSTEDVIDGVFTSTITGSSTSYGNQATCNHYKIKCGSGYREWIKDGEIACACDVD